MKPSRVPSLHAAQPVGGHTTPLDDALDALDALLLDDALVAEVELVELDPLDDAEEALVAEEPLDADDDAAVDALALLEVVDELLEGAGPAPPPPSDETPNVDLAPHAASSPVTATAPRSPGLVFAMRTRGDDTSCGASTSPVASSNARPYQVRRKYR
jgi:hypothetical protein